jgi:hypothetical protein
MENDKEEGGILVTKGCKPQIKQPVTVYTTNSFKPLSTNDDPRQIKQCNKPPQSNNPRQQRIPRNADKTKYESTDVKPSND